MLVQPALFAYLLCRPAFLGSMLSGCDEIRNPGRFGQASFGKKASFFQLVEAL
jgi:hypothetical protein